MTNESRATSALNILGPKDLSTAYFDAILGLPGGQVVSLREASWSHRGRWHLSGVLHGSPEDRLALADSEAVEIIYPDRSSERIEWYTVPGNLVYQVTEVHGRFGAYVKAPPRFPRGRDAERQAGVEVTRRVVPELHKLLSKLVPDLDQQRKTWVITALEQWRTREIAQSNRLIARQLADSLDRRADLRRRVTAQIDCWEPGDDDEQVRSMLDRVERLLDLDEKGLPLD